REERRRIQHALEPWQLPGHLRSLSAAVADRPSSAACAQQQVKAGRSGRDEESAEEIAGASAPDHRLHEQRDADPDEEQRECGRARAIGLHAAFRPAATMTRHGACFSTKSTVSLKTALRARSVRGVPMTMISVWRR